MAARLKMKSGRKGEAMEFLKEIFGTEALTYDQLAAKVSEKKMKLADLSGGAYVGKEKYDTLTAERDSLKTRLDDANGKLEGYDPEWKNKAAQAQTEAENKIKALQRLQALKEQSSSLKFSSESAKRAFLSDLEARDLPLEDGRVIGFDEFVKKYRETDPDAFAPDKPAPSITIPGHGQPTKLKAQTILDEKYKNNTLYHQKGE